MASANPGKEAPVAAANVHRIFSNYVIRMWMRDQRRRTRRGLYGPSKVTTTVGPDKQQIAITQTTRYPFEEQIHSRSMPTGRDDVSSTLRIRRGARHRVSHQCAAHSGFSARQRLFDPGSKVRSRRHGDLDSSDANRHHAWPQSGIGIERGPLCIRADQGEMDARVEPKLHDEDFPSWEATPESAWNYGIAVPCALAARGQT